MKYSSIGYAVTFGFVFLSTIISEFAQIVSNRYDKPFIIRYINDGSNIFGLLIPFIWLCTSSLFVEKVKKDRQKLLKRNNNKSETTDISSITDSQYQYYQSSPLGMDGPYYDNNFPNNDNTKSEESKGSLFGSVYKNFAEIGFDDTDLESLAGAHLSDKDDTNSLNQSIGSKSSVLYNGTNASNLSNLIQKRNNISIIKLHLFHPYPNKFKSYKDSLKHIHSTIHIALVKSQIYYFIPFLIILSWLYSGGGMLWYLSLTGTTVPTNTCLARFRVLFVFILSAIFFNEIVNLWKIIGIIFAFSSVALFALEIESQKSNDTSSETHDTLSGALLILLAALFSACGDVVYRIGAHKCLNSDKIYGLPLVVTFFFNGLYGLVILSTFWGIFYIEPFVMPNYEDIYLIFGVSLVLMIANVVQFVSISMTSPFFLNVCLFLKIPLSFIVDIFVHDYKLGLYSTCGGILVCMGFLILEIISPPKCLGKCKDILQHPWFRKQIETIRKRTESFNIDINTCNN